MQPDRDEVFEVARKLADIDDPHFASEVSGDVHCFFCNAWHGYEAHTQDCLWATARRLFGLALPST